MPDHDCGHVCCFERSDPLHDHFLTSEQCPRCEARRGTNVPDPTRRRRYSAAEAAAFRACGMNPMYGPAQFAGGPYWPDELDRRADRLEALIPHLRLAAAALRREIAAVPLTTDPVVEGSV